MKADEARRLTENSVASIHNFALEEVYQKIKLAASNGREEVVLEMPSRCTTDLILILRTEGYRVVAKSSPRVASLDVIKICW